MKQLRTSIAALAICLTALCPSAMGAETIWLSDMDLSRMTAGWGTPQKDRSIQSRPLSIAGKIYEKGVGSHANSRMEIALDGKGVRFEALVGADDEVRPNTGTIQFKVYGDGRKLFDSGLIKTGMPSAPVSVELDGLRKLVLVVSTGNDGNGFDHADWAEAKIAYEGAMPSTTDVWAEEKAILTPPPLPEPRIHHPRITGVRPGHPFLFRIPATGVRPMRFSAAGLPEGLSLNESEGILSGQIADMTHRTWTVAITASNPHGTDRQNLKIAVGDTLALTPPMGWNDWYFHTNKVTDAIMRQAADQMILSGMADVGYQYVNIDDCWMNAEKDADPNHVGPLRDNEGNILPNQYFPNMKALTDYIHAKGLRAGLYTSPGKTTCGGYSGSYGHEKQDAETFADWGFDFLKYDWCSYGAIAKNDSLDELKRPYQIMGDILKSLDRDIILNHCQYGMGNVWEWGEEVGGHCWRTAGDLGFELGNYHQVAFKNAEHHPYAHPGAWNDPDYLLMGAGFPLSPNQQYSYFSLWCLMASPLFFTGDMGQLDSFTLNILCNAEMIAINQDALGKQGYPVRMDEERDVWKKELENGDLAVGLFNRGEMEADVTLDWNDIGIEGPRNLRDLWRQKDLGAFDQSYTVNVPPHGVAMLRLSK